MDFDVVDTVNDNVAATVIKVVGVGGAGGNAVSHMLEKGMGGVDFICVNSDYQALSKTNAGTTIGIGKDGLGAGMDPEKGEAMAESERERITEALDGAQMVFVTAGMGGGTGTGASPVIAGIARDLGILVVSVVTMPFSHEGKKRISAATEGLEKLKQVSDSIIIVLNENLMDELPDGTMEEWFKEADDVLRNAVAGIVEIIHSTGRVNVDFNDIKTIMREKGRAMIGTATAAGVDRARIAAEQSTTSPLLDGMHLNGAKGVVLNISAARETLRGREVREIIQTVQSQCVEDVNLVHGLVYEDDMGDELRVTLIATGLSGGETSMRMVNTAARTGTDDVEAPSSDDKSDLFSSGDSQASAAVFRSSDATARVRSLESRGVERHDIPAYLRKQAD